MHKSITERLDEIIRGFYPGVHLTGLDVKRPVDFKMHYTECILKALGLDEDLDDVGFYEAVEREFNTKISSEERRRPLSYQRLRGLIPPYYTLSQPQLL